MSLKSLYRFSEQRYHSFLHDLKIYIFGQDVSQWLRGSLNITYGNRDSFNTAAFELSNPRKIFQITQENWSPKPPLTGFRVGAGEYSETVKAQIFDWKSDPYINPFFKMDIKAVNLGTIAEQGVNSVDLLKGNPEIKAEEERAYRLALNDCIFNKNDPMRIFMRNPLMPRSVDEWVEIFCGFVQDHPVSTNYMTGESTVRINVSDIRQQMTKMRAASNTLVNFTDPAKIVSSGFYADFKEATMLTQQFATSSLEDAIRSLVLGSLYKGEADSGKTGDGNAVIHSNGVGGFKLGNVVCYDPDNPGNTLERWHLMTIFGVNKVGWPTGEEDDLWLTSKEVETLGRQTVPLAELTTSGPMSRYLHFLLPKAGTGASTLTDYTVEQMTGTQNWTTRWEIIRDYASKLDFQVLVSPSGDLLVEFPQYGFTPASYTHKPWPGIPFAANSGEKIEGSPGLSKLLTFDMHQKEETINDEGEDFPTILMISGGVAFRDTNIKTDENVAVNQPRSFVYAPALVSRYGVIVETHDVPYAGQTADDQANTPGGGVLMKRLSKIGLIEFMKRMANSSSLDSTVVYRPFLFPNRPVYFKKSQRIGVLTSVTYSWNVGKDAGITLNANMLMAQRPDGSFRLLTGAADTPISYKNLWSSDDPGYLQSGVRSLDSDGQVTQPPTNSPDAPKGKDGVHVQPSSKDINGLWPGFRSMVKDIIAAWNKQNPDDPVSLTSALRTAQHQGSLNKGEGMAAEPFRSLHQFGLAVDMGPRSCMKWVKQTGNKVIDASPKLPGGGTLCSGTWAKFIEFATNRSRSSSFGAIRQPFGADDIVHFEADLASSDVYAPVKVRENRMALGRQMYKELGDAFYTKVWEQMKAKATPKQLEIIKAEDGAPTPQVAANPDVNITKPRDAGAPTAPANCTNSELRSTGIG